MKKNGWEYEKAENGLLALQAFQNSSEGFDVIFMGKLRLFLYFERAKLLFRCLYAHHDRV